MLHTTPQKVAILGCLLCFATFASAQDSKTTKSTPRDFFAAPKSAVPAAPPSGTWSTKRFEISIQGGGVVGGNWGNGNYGHCFSGLTAPNGCDPNQFLTHTTSFPAIGVYSGQIGGIRRFQNAGGVNPGNGPALGVRVGWNFNPHWQFEVIYNHTWQPMSFSNQMLGDRAIEEFVLQGGGFNRSSIHNLTFFDKDTGRPRGEQNMWLFNLNRNFNAGSRFVPYIGGGIGFVDWYAGPKLNLATEDQGNTGVTKSAEVTKFAGRGMGFAFDVAAGAKWYWTQHLGARFDFTDVISFPHLTNVAQTRDLSDFRGAGANSLWPISGATRQVGRFNQAMFTAGLFWAFGHEMSAPGGGQTTGDRDSLHDRWEVSWTLGGVWGSTLSSGVGHCVSEPGLISDGCDLNQTDHDTTGVVSVFPGRIAHVIPEFLARRSVRPGNGWITGGRIGYKFTPAWELDFIYNYSGAPTEFENKPSLDHAEEFFYGFDRPCSNNCTKALNFLGGADGRPQGNQSQLLVNIQYNVHPQKRFVPYLAAGVGAELWNGNPRVLLETNTSKPSQNRIAWFSKTIPSTTGFAFDIATGAKYYVSRHWGFRTDITNVWSFQDLNARFATIDTSGQFGTPGAHLPVSGRISRSGTANQLSGQAGVFVTF